MLIASVKSESGIPLLLDKERVQKYALGGIQLSLAYKKTTK